ncbi:helix-turn-helix domain-containing protein [Paenibacillus sp. URB8-2]|uniref:helix-turn-helix domain-containing protein n=1 Tax=Paenibacillus sp. URB8-2 TaxID=2741301 RepID=UPI0015B8F272|nr:helix-turn-helix domain-containing protein [Paenibacillus sp. URB8-2]
MAITDILEVQERQEIYASNIFSSRQLRENIITYKMLCDAVEAAGIITYRLSDEDFLDKDKFLSAQQDIVFLLTQVQGSPQAKSIRVKHYPTREVARMLGVSHQTISRWISQGRFKGVSRSEPGKHVDIPVDTLLEYPSGEVVQISGVAEAYHQRMQIAARTETDDELSFINNKLASYEERYGPFEQLKQKSDSGELSASDEDVDLDVWTYLLKRKQELLG